MVAYSPSDLNAVFGALADPTRRAIVARLMQGPSTITELARPFDMSTVAVSKHIRVLETAGLVARHKRGRSCYCRLQESTRLQVASQWLRELEAFWHERLDRLADYLTSPHTEE